MYLFSSWRLLFQTNMIPQLSYITEEKQKAFTAIIETASKDFNQAVKDLSELNRSCRGDLFSFIRYHQDNKLADFELCKKLKKEIFKTF